MVKYLAVFLLVLCTCDQVTLAQASNEPKRPSEDEIRQWPLPQQAAYRAATFVEEIPNFLVTQIIVRSSRNTGKKDWQAQDTLEIELSYQGKKGEHRILRKINDRPTSQSYEKVVGATSQGEFGGFLSRLVDPRSQAQFKPIKNEVLRGRKTMLFEFRVGKANSGYVLTEKSSGRKVNTGLVGTIWVDTETARILRLEFSVDDVPSGFPLNVAEHAVEYDWVTIGAQKYWLPTYAEFIVGNDITRSYERNVTEFKNYRVFETDLKIIEEKRPLH